jgi:hypothetical protein
VIEAFLASAAFRYFVFPLLSVLLGIYLRYVSKNDQYSGFRKEDMAVGFDLIRAALLMYVVLLSDQARSLVSANDALARLGHQTPQDPMAILKSQETIQIESHGLIMGGWLLFILFMGLWGTSTVVRKKGWTSESELHTLFGITIPLVVGTLYLSLVVVMAEGRP